MNQQTDKAVIYARFSPRRNASDCESIETQKSYCAKYCEFHQWEVLGVHEDAGLSGAKSDNRPGLQAALLQAKKNRAVLVVYSLSRLSRSTRDAIEIAEELNRAKANLCSVTEKIDTTSAYGSFFFTIMAAMGELERKQISERTSEAMHCHQQNGRKMSKIPPYGWKDDPENPARMLPDEQEVAIIDEIRELHEQKKSFAQIARELTKRGRKPRPRTKLFKGKPVTVTTGWSRFTVRNIVNRIIAGRC